MTAVWQSIVRTVVPIIVGWLLSLPAVQWLGITDEQAAMAVTAVLSALYYVLARALERAVPRLGVLLGWPGEPLYAARHRADTPPPADAGRAQLVDLVLGALVVLLLAAIFVLAWAR